MNLHIHPVHFDSIWLELASTTQLIKHKLIKYKYEDLEESNGASGHQYEKRMEVTLKDTQKKKKRQKIYINEEENKTKQPRRLDRISKPPEGADTKWKHA